MKQKIWAICALPLASALSLAQSSERVWVQPVTPKPPPRTATNASPKDNPAWRKRALELVQNSHALNQQLTLDKEGIGLMRMQIEVVSQLDLDLARSWTIEAFEVAQQMDAHSAFNAQLSIATVLRQADPDLALRLLVQIDPGEASNFSPIGSYFRKDPYRQAAGAIFSGYSRSGRDPAKLRSAAEEMGSRGVYPYSALMMAAAMRGNPEEQAQVFARLLARYQQQSTSVQDDADFAAMLQDAAAKIPVEEFKAAVQLLTQRILRYDPEPGKNLSVTVSLEDSKANATARGPIEITLLRILPLIKRADPFLLKQVIASYPNLSAGIESDGTNWRSIRFSDGNDGTHLTEVPDASDEAVEKLRVLRWTDPAAARRAAEAVPDPAIRAQALTEMLQEQIDDPKAVQELSAQVAAAAKDAKDEETKFSAALARLIAACVNKNVMQVNEALDPAFTLADKLTQKAADEHSKALDHVYGLQQAVSECIQVSTEPTIGFINGLTWPYARAEVLSWAAYGLMRGMPKAPPPKPAK
jgi:hypothetical protein